MDADSIRAVITIFADLAAPAFGIAFVFAFGGKMVRSFLNMGFDGKFKL